MLTRSSCELELVKRRPPRTCDRWQKLCPSPPLLVANKNTLETLFRLSRHLLKVLAFSCSLYPPQYPGPSTLPMCSAKILGFLLVLLETVYMFGVAYDLFFFVKGNVCAVSSFWLGMLLDIIPAKCGTSLFTL